ncbi:MAG TPA: chemotaxis protein CheW [Myxococcota bacterium]
MQSPNPVAFQDNRVTLSCFEVAGGVYAMDVSNVREVVRWQPITPLPKAPLLISGVIDLRGVIVPVVDLGEALNARACEPNPTTRIVVVEVDNLLMGLVVDSAIEVIQVATSALEDPPALATQAGYDATRAVVRRPGEPPILVLSLEHVLESVYKSALATSEDAS